MLCYGRGMNTVRVNLTNLGTGKVELNGKDVSSAVAGLTINANVGDATSVLLRLPAVAVSVDAEARIELPEYVEELLVAAGWTPPGDKPGLLVEFPGGISPDELGKFMEEFRKARRGKGA